MGPLSPRRADLLVLRMLSILVMIGTCLAADAVAATTTVPAGADLQLALNAARPGDVLVLQAGARYIGPFKLPPNPVGAVGREALLEKALGRAAVKAQTTRERLALVQPPLDELLP